MKCVVHEGAGLEGVRVATLEPRPLGPRDCRVRLVAAALNHRDIWTCKRHRPGEPPLILGADGAGVVEAVGPGVRGIAPGAEVVINPALNWPSGSAAPPENFEILGHPTHGTFAEKIVIPAANLEPKPAHLSWTEAAALPLSGLTAYRALFTCGGLKPGQTVAIPGIGGGTALQALQLAKAAGARVIATSTRAVKRGQALAAGAELALDTGEDWPEVVRRFTGGRGAEIVVESVGRPTWEKSLAALARGGRLVVYGSTGGDRVELELPPFFLNWRSIRGTTMGNRVEFRAMLRFVAEHRLRPVVDRVFRLADGPAALRHLAAGDQFGKVVLDMAG